MTNGTSIANFFCIFGYFWASSSKSKVTKAMISDTPNHRFASVFGRVMTGLSKPFLAIIVGNKKIGAINTIQHPEFGVPPWEFSLFWREAFTLGVSPILRLHHQMCGGWPQFWRRAPVRGCLRGARCTALCNGGLKHRPGGAGAGTALATGGGTWRTSLPWWK